MREGGRVRQEIVANLGKLSDREAERIGQQLLAIAGKLPAQGFELQQGPGYLYGGPLLVQTLMELARLEPLLRPLGETRRLDLYRTLTVALCAQLLAPGSELHTRHWQRQLLFTRAPYTIPYERFLRALDVLADCHPALEEGLFARVAHLFNQQVDLVFYDLTSSYFEGAGPADLARRGYSRDGRPDCVQIVVDLAVTKDGFPFAYRVHRGNTVDVKTVEALAADFRQRFRIDRCLVVGDSGLLSDETAGQFTRLGLRYLLGLRATGNRLAQEAIAATREQPPAGQIGEVTYWPTQVRDGKAYVVLHSPGSRPGGTKTTAIAQRKLDAVRPKLQQLERDVRAGKVPLRHQPLQPRVLLLQLPQPPRLRHAHPPVLPPPPVERVLRDPLLAAELPHALPALRRRPQQPDDLLLAEPFPLHREPPYHREILTYRVDQFSGSRARIPPLQLRKQRLLVPLPAWTTAGLAAGLCHSAETALATVQELRAVPVALPDGPVWPLPYVSATSAALFRALGLPDPKARFEADPALAGPRPSTPHNLRAPANPPLRTSPSKRRLPRP